jgi:hypothetical protein
VLIHENGKNDKEADKNTFQKENYKNTYKI